MKRFLSFSILAGLMVSMAAFAEETPIQYTFSGATAEENKVTLQGAGFGAYPQASVTFGYLPTDNAFDGATDGQGAIVTAKPGEGVMIFASPVTTTNAALIRCVVRTDQEHAAVTLASIGNKPDSFIAQNSPGNEAFFYGQYKRLAVSCIPPSTGFQPVIQIMNTSQTESLTAFLDNFEIYLLDPNKYTSNAFLDGDESDPPADKISIPSNAESGALPSGDLSVKVGQITLDVSIEMEQIPAGSFIMGSTHWFCHDAPPHQVTISKPFYMGKYEITQAQWKAVLDAAYAKYPNDATMVNLSNDQTSREPSVFKKNWTIDPNRPVENVSLYYISGFLYAINLLELGTFRLPTEAEWEYACRAGTTTDSYWGDKPIDDYCWSQDNSSGQTHDVGLKKPNDWGLYDMIGNVGEWCQDWYGADYYGSSPQENPTGPESGKYMVQRGCSWYDHPSLCLSPLRSYDASYSQSEQIGFRVVYTPKEEGNP